LRLFANPYGFAQWFLASTPPDEVFGLYFEKASLDYDRMRREGLAKADANPVPVQMPVYRKSRAVISLQLIKRWRNLAYDRRHATLRVPPSVLIAYYVAINANQTRIFTSCAAGAFRPWGRQPCRRRHGPPRGVVLGVNDRCVRCQSRSRIRDCERNARTSVSSRMLAGWASGRARSVRSVRPTGFASSIFRGGCSMADFCRIRMSACSSSTRPSAPIHAVRATPPARLSTRLFSCVSAPVYP
jgi:hypothetical protein